MDLGIEGRVALVCAASKGIGRAIAAELVAEGARVVITSRSQENVEATAAEIGAIPFVHDTADLEMIPAVVDRAAFELDAPIDILVCNTGGPPMGADPMGFAREEWEEAYRTLVLAPMAFVEAVLPGMRERGWGRIVNVVSTTVREPSPVLMLSNSHRAATLAAFKTIARSVAADGVTLNSVLPGRIATDRVFDHAGGREAAEEAASSLVPAGRLGTPEEFAAAAAFLCSARASYITGTALLVDGGLTQSV
jgi:3-oxoacyl-[acyl-carrier protein] reductase